MPGTSCKALQREAPFRTGSSPHLQPTPAEHRRRGFLPHSQGFEIRERHRSRSRCWSRARCSDCQREGSTTPASRCSLTWSLSVGWKIEPAPKFDRDRTPHVQHDLGPNSHHGDKAQLPRSPRFKVLCGRPEAGSRRVRCSPAPKAPSKRLLPARI